MSDDVVDQVFPRQEVNVDLTSLRHRLQDVLNDLGLELAPTIKVVQDEVVVTFGMLVGYRDIDRVLRRLEDLRQALPEPEQIHQNTSLF